MSDKKEIVSASPKVRKLAREFGADIYQIKGSQREGRVSEEDVKYFKKESISGKVEKKQLVTKEQYRHSEFGDVETKSIPRLKKIANPHLEKAWSEIPHVTQHDEADITEMEKFRKSLRDLYTGDKLSITPLAFIIRAVVQALKDYPNFNSSLDLKKEKIYHHVGIYCFQSSQLKKYVELGESRQEKILKLEQIRLIGKVEIKVGYCDSNPLSIDTLEDLKRIEREMS